MKHLVVAALAASTIAGSAFAADLPSRAVPVAAPAPVFTWAGSYIGLNGGWTWAGTKTSNFATVGGNLVPLTPFGFEVVSNSSVAGSGPVSSPSSGFMGGVTIGHNWQFGPSFVAGLEADIAGVFSQDNGQTINVLPITTAAVGPTVAKLGVSKSLDYFGTLRARAGFAISPSLLLFGTGGLAYGGTRASASVANLASISGALGSPYSSFSSGGYSALRVGWTLGAGAEYKFTSFLSAKLEYLYYDLGTARYNAGARTTFEGAVAFMSHATAVSTRFNGHIVRAGLNYHFGQSAGPVVAKY